MVSVLNDRILEFHPDTLKFVRKEVNLDQDGRIDEAVDILVDWVKKQSHFTKKDFSRDYLEKVLIIAKGMVERAKKRIDKLCTFKTLMPELYPAPASKEQFDSLDNHIRYALLPKMTKEYYRVSTFNAKSEDYQTSDIYNFFKYHTVLCEYLMKYDYNCGFVMCFDFRNVNIIHFITRCPVLELGKAVTLFTEGYGLRIKQIHLITSSKMIDALVTFIKKALSIKLGERIHVHKTINTLYDFVPNEILPEEFGGKERSLQTLSDEWRNRVTAKDFTEYFDEMNQARTDESCRQRDQFNEQYLGVPGSFRALSLD